MNDEDLNPEPKVITIIGGTGVFGSRIATELAADSSAQVRLVGRHRAIGEALADGLGAEFIQADITDAKQLTQAVRGSTIVIHAAGPFQAREYDVARACIDAGCHYLDLADARQFVTGIVALHETARNRGVFICSGASSVPAITHAIVQSLRHEFVGMDEVYTALSPGNQNPRGASTIGAILSYLGRPIQMWIDRTFKNVTGWGDAQRIEFPPPVGFRRVHNCEVPDLELFPKLFSVATVRFQAGVELDAINYLLSIIAGLRQIVPMRELHNRGALFLKLSMLLYRRGSKNGSLSVWIQGRDRNHSPIERRAAIVTDDDGPATPCSPSIILARKILKYGPPDHGAFPCVGFINLEEILAHLHHFGVWITRGDERGWEANVGCQK